MSKIKKTETETDIILENLKGFIRLGAAATSPGNVPTGHFDLDFAIHYGELPADIDLDTLKDYDPSKTLGLPRGKVIELFGPEGGGKSSLAYRVVGYGQKIGLKAAWIDTEHSFADNLAELNGVDRDSLFYSNMTNHFNPEQLFYAEDVFDGIIAMIKSGIKVIVLDSVANLVSKERMEKDAEAFVVARVARLMSDNLGKIVAYADKEGALVIFINQIREKVGVMFGCFHYNSRVILADGTTEKIGKIVNQKMDVEVLSYNPHTHVIEPKKIIDWHDNGNLNEDECFLQFVVDKFGGNGRTQFACTPNHKLLVPYNSVDLQNTKKQEEVSACDLDVGDELMVMQPHYLTDIQRQVVYGSILGDGSIRKGGSCSQLRLGHGVKQREYCQWKQEILQPWVSYVEDIDKRYCFDTIPMYELNRLRFRFEHTDGALIPQEVADNLDLLGLAIWYMDDGTFSGHYAKWGNGKSIIYSTKFANASIMLPALNRLGLDVKLNKKGFVFNSENTRILHSLICEFVPPSMDYKLHPNFRGKYYFEIDDLSDEIIYKPVSAKILDIYEKPPTRTKKKFDLTIEDNATYIVDGAIVHNSPETTPGGRSLKHNASIRLKIQKTNKNDENAIYIVNEDGKKTLIGRNSSVSLVKNRFAKPLDGSIKIPIYYASHFPEIEELLFEFGRQLKLIKVYKGTFKWKCGKDETEVLEADGKDVFLKMMEYNEMQMLMAEDLIATAKETKTIVPPEISKWIDNNKNKKKKAKKTDDKDPQISEQTAGGGEI